jgi:hypothetical protein
MITIEYLNSKTGNTIEYTIEQDGNTGHWELIGMFEDNVIVADTYEFLIEATLQVGSLIKEEYGVG